jgi:3-oxoacyl-[acyl-carrier protein] reductase
MASGDDVADLLDRAESAEERLHAVILASVGPAATDHGELTALDPIQWAERVEIPLHRTLACFQGSYRRLRGRGGCLVVLVPTLSLVGAAGLVPWAAVAEAQRALAKSAGRAWGREGISVNCVAIPAALLLSRPPLPEAAGGDGPDRATGSDRPGLPPPSLERAPSWESDVAPVLVSLTASGWTGVTGATIAVDGGVWMTP